LSTTDSREYCYVKYMEAIGCYDEDLVKIGSFTPASGYKLMKEALETEDYPTAFFIANDSMAIGAYRAVMEKGISIPKDISIIGVNDISSAQFMVPALSTVKIYTDFMGDTAVGLLIEKIKSARQISKKVIIPTKLIVRDSCRSINK